MMKIFQGKSKEEKIKIVAAVVLGTLAFLAVGYNLIGFFPSRKPTVASASPTPTPAKSTTGDRVVRELPAQNEIDAILSTIPVVYPIVALGAPDAGRNIFAFYEPPVPTPWSPTPVPTSNEVIKTPPPTPTPPQFVAGFNPQTVYAGTGGFTLNVDGMGFTPETRIFINNIEMPTRYLGPQRLATDVPSNLVSGGQLQVFTRSPDGKLYSLPTFFNIAQPPRPQFQYVGIVAPKLGNNATAYLQEGTATPQARRLDDRIGVCAGNSPGCFRIVSIARERVIVQDVALGFRYTIEMARTGGSTTPGTTTNPSIRNPNLPNPQECPAGIPCETIPRVPNPSNRNPIQPDVDDNDKDNRFEDRR